MSNRKMNLQLFGEDDPDQEMTKTTRSESQGKTFSEDYVKTIREEAKENRLARKAEEDKSKQLEEQFKLFKGKVGTFLGLGENDEVDESKMEAFKKSLLSKANEKLLKAEIKSLDGYDAKLVERLIDKSKVEITDDGEVVGLKELVEKLAEEFPQIKVAKGDSGVNPPPTGATTELDRLKEQYNQAEKNRNTVLMMAIQNKIRALKK